MAEGERREADEQLDLVRPTRKCTACEALGSSVTCAWCSGGTVPYLNRHPRVAPDVGALRAAIDQATRRGDATMLEAAKARLIEHARALVRQSAGQ